jgi:hypothetical protein
MADNDEVRDNHDELGDDDPSYYLPDPEPEDCERCGGWGWIDGDDLQGDCPECKP